MCELDTRDERDDWLDGVRRWYFGGTPGPDDETGACAEVGMLHPQESTSWSSDTAEAGLGRHA